MSESEFRENINAQTLDKEQQELLSRKICDLSLKIQGTQLEARINQLYAELEKKGISFKPETYLADEWGCPQGVPAIGIPFYLADRELSRLEGQLTGIEAENEQEVIMDLRHETGHAFNYAYHLHTRADWRRIFGQYSRPYQENYRPVPFSTRFVHHLPGWYAQKHPDEDFAETFAVWLTPDSDWRIRYADTPALAKLLYVDKVALLYGPKSPVVTVGKLDSPVQELNITLDKWYESFREKGSEPVLPRTLDYELKRLFSISIGQPAAPVLTSNRSFLIHEVNLWTGINRRLLSLLVDKLIEQVKTLDLKIIPDENTAQMLSFTVFVTTLSMNYLARGQFIDI